MNKTITTADRIRYMKRNILALCISAAIRYPGA